MCKIHISLLSVYSRHTLNWVSSLSSHMPFYINNILRGRPLTTHCTLTIAFWKGQNSIWNGDPHLSIFCSFFYVISQLVNTSNLQTIFSFHAGSWQTEAGDREPGADRVVLREMNWWWRAARQRRLCSKLWLRLADAHPILIYSVQIQPVCYVPFTAAAGPGSCQGCS